MVWAEQNMQRKQRKLARKEKGSHKREKARLLIAKAHERVGNARHDWQHKVARQLVNENQAVIVEDEELSLAQRSWHCAICGALHDRDVNAAQNVLQHGVFTLQAAGLTVSACGDVRKSALGAVAASEVGSRHL
jgi:putative transposase